MFIIQELTPYLFLLTNAVVWAILIVAVVCYGLLIDLCFVSRQDQLWLGRCHHWIPTLKTILASLPLLGLLGTISGLLVTFFSMSVEQGLDEDQIISGGIAQAMLTTQLGLVFVIPGLLMLSLLTSKVTRFGVTRI